MENNGRSFYYYRDIVLCIQEIKGMMIKHDQANWIVDVIYTNGSIMSYQCIHRDEAQQLFTALRDMLGAKEIVLEEKYF